MLNWLLYAGLVGGLLTLAAHCVGRVCQLIARPTRWVWVGALTLTVVLAGVAPYRATGRSHAQSTQGATHPTRSEVRLHVPSSIGRLSESWQLVRRKMTTPLPETMTIPVQRVPASLDSYLAVAWSTLSVLVFLFFSTVYLRFSRARRDWPISELHGVRVRIAPDGGPAVIGVLHPDIVIPQWLLGHSAEEQRMVLTHEQEHIRTGDPWLLAGACAVAALLPWHPFVWWMLARLRLAIELDCDARVLRQEITPRTYGSLLIDLAARCSGLPVRALALADNRSHLKQRLLAMKSFRPRFAVPQGVFLGTSALCCLVTACLAQVSEQADRHMNPTDWNRSYETIARVFREEDNPDRLYQGAKTPEDSAARFFGVIGNSRGIGVRGISSSTTWSEYFKQFPVVDSVYARFLGHEAARNAAEPNTVRDSVLVLVDGVRRGVFPINERIPFSQLHLSPDGIQQFNVKRGGHWAVVLYGPQAANGVVDVTTTEGEARSRAAIMHRSDSLGEWSREIGGEWGTRDNGNPSTLLQLFDSLEYSRLGDSVLILVDSTRRGVFPIREHLPFSQLNLHPDDIQSFLVTSGPTAVRKYGPNTHGAINIITKTQQERERERESPPPEPLYLGEPH